MSLTAWERRQEAAEGRAWARDDAADCEAEEGPPPEPDYEQQAAELAGRTCRFGRGRRYAGILAHLRGRHGVET